MAPACEKDKQIYEGAILVKVAPMGKGVRSQSWQRIEWAFGHIAAEGS